jgi:hypothetical protein
MADLTYSIQTQLSTEISVAALEWIDPTELK